eukprot:13612871-Heterocapsa_arctica.AAC.1
MSGKTPAPKVAPIYTSSSGDSPTRRGMTRVTLVLFHRCVAWFTNTTTCFENEEASPGWSIMTVGDVSTLVSWPLRLGRCRKTPPDDDMEEGVQRRG